MSPTEFAECMTNGHFAQEEHKAYPVLLYYSAVRKWEGLRALREQFTIDYNDAILYFDVGPRLKKVRRRRKGKALSKKRYDEIFEKRKASITTPPIPIPMDMPFMEELIKRIEQAEFEQEPIFPWSPKTV